MSLFVFDRGQVVQAGVADRVSTGDIKTVEASTQALVRGCGCPKLRAWPVTCPFVHGKWPGMIR